MSDLLFRLQKSVTCWKKFVFFTMFFTFLSPKVICYCRSLYKRATVGASLPSLFTKNPRANFLIKSKGVNLTKSRELPVYTNQIT